MRAYPRQGISMLEMLVYVSLSAVLVALTTQWFHVIFQVASKNKVRQRQHASLKLLASEFRADVISASDLSLDSPQQLTLTSVADGEILYRISSGQVERIVGDIAKPARIEVYRDLDDLRLEFVDGASASNDAPLQWVSMNVFRPVPKKKLEQTDPQISMKEPDIEKPLLQLRCGPRPPKLESVQ